MRSYLRVSRYTLSLQLNIKKAKTYSDFWWVVRCRLPKERKNLAGIRFEGLDERVRTFLIEFLFERMRLQRRLKDD